MGTARVAAAMPSMAFRPPLTLRGDRVTLVPFETQHEEALWAASRDPRVGRYLLLSPGETREEFEQMIATLLERQSTGNELLFTTTLTDAGTPIGMTRFIQIERPYRCVEIGGTWLDPLYWDSPINTEAKWLMMRHAFEVEGAHRVWLRTDVRNLRSQRAIERLGAVREAVLREHLLLRDGSYRSSVYYGILENEWPEVRGRLEEKLRRPWTPPSRGPP
jgi:N-acetyltransferase